jgi:ADP-dependent NAD(P)H-hydrate dehydratase / NAD(P)H-hydrate epimerase
MTAVVSTEEMRRLEQAAVEAGASWAGLMEAAGAGVSRFALAELQQMGGRSALVLVGPGNNGGDGLVAARRLHDAGVPTSLCVWRRSKPAEDANWQACRARDLPEVLLAGDEQLSVLRALCQSVDLVIDAMFGMGMSRPLVDLPAVIVETVNRAVRGTVLAIDMPSGVNSDSGDIMGTALRADVTVATGLPKRGLLLYPGREYAGRIELAPIDLPPETVAKLPQRLMQADWIAPLLPARPANSHKGSFGKAMIVAGSRRYPGAAGLCSTAAGRAGAGLVTLATPAGSILATGRGMESTLLPLPETANGEIAAETAALLQENLAGYQALLIGPGLGQAAPTAEFVQQLLAGRPNLPRLILDADALNVLSRLPDWPQLLPPERCVLTPHPGEMRRLLAIAQLPSDPLETASAAARNWRQVVVLKGASTVVAAPDGRCALHAEGNSAMATAGSGDVLAGALAGLLAQGSPLYEAAVLAVYLHGRAGVLLRGEIGAAGALAGDLLERLPRAIAQLRDSPRQA